jgi:hypothetical protein
MSNSVYIEIVFQKNKPKSAYAVRCFKIVIQGKKLLLTLLYALLQQSTCECLGILYLSYNRIIR